MGKASGALHSALAALHVAIEPGGVVFLHGLKSSPNGTKARWLRENLGACAVDLDTTAAIAFYQSAQISTTEPGPANPAFDRAFKKPMARARRALRDNPAKVVVGSSFGGAVLLKLIHEGSWKRSSVFIAQAGVKLTAYDSLPSTVPAVFLHGVEDTEIPIADSRLLAKNSGPQVQLWEIEDDHRMHSILESGILAMAILTSLNIAP
jgi:pimeloyl-ACP methyl ester carboxylesterase